MSPLHDLFDNAFKLGFMISREGFNAECPYEHLAPHKLEPHYETFEEYLNEIENNKAFNKLLDDAREKYLG